jgi:Phosphotransferase enzyme family
MNEPAVRAEHRLRPEHGWVAAALPATARRLRVSDRSLAGMLAAAGADVCGSDPEVDIGPVETIGGDTPIAIVPIVSISPLVGPRPLRMALRATAAVAVRARAVRARSRLKRRGYAMTDVWRWDVEQVLRVPGARPRRLRAVEYLPRAAVVTGRRAEGRWPSLLDAVVSEASCRIGQPVDVGRPYVTGSGTLLLFTPTHVLRVAVGPGRHHLERHRTALAELTALDPPPLVTDRLPRLVAGGEVGLSSWLLEERLPGVVPDVLDVALFEQGVDYLVALHGCGGGDGEPLVRAAETIAALSGAPSEPLVRVARQLDEELATVPRGFGHGDFWRKNVLVDGGRLRGVADWERAGDGRLPLLDLLQLTVAQPPLERLPFAAVVAEKLLPWAHAGGDAAARRYCAQLGLEASTSLLRSLVLAFWLDRLARELEKCGDKGGTPAWLAGNVDPVLTVAEDR